VRWADVSKDALGGDRPKHTHDEIHNDVERMRRNYRPDYCRYFSHVQPPMLIAFSRASHPVFCELNPRAKFELVVNLKKAKALGLSIRESFLLLAMGVKRTWRLHCEMSA